jgi:hypothetical protein
MRRLKPNYDPTLDFSKYQIAEDKAIKLKQKNMKTNEIFFGVTNENKSYSTFIVKHI